MKYSNLANTKCCTISRPASCRDGVAVVEFALAAILLVTLILGTVEISRAILVKEALSNAARAGCRVACLADGSNARVMSEVKAILSESGYGADDVEITISVNGDTKINASAARRYDRIQVTVAMPLSKIVSAPTNFLSPETMMAESLVMMKQN